MGATLGATDTNDFPIVWTDPDARTGVYGSQGLRALVAVQPQADCVRIREQPPRGRQRLRWRWR
jgi:hypothetical protein